MDGQGDYHRVPPTSSDGARKIAAMKNLKKSFGDCIIETGSKMPRHLVSKLSGAFNFIGTLALKLCTNIHNLIMNLTQHVTSQTNVKYKEKQKYKMKVIWVRLFKASLA